MNARINVHYRLILLYLIKLGKLLFLIEFDGEQHFKPVKFSGNEDLAKHQFKICKEHDEIKNSYCKSNSIKLLRISNKKKIKESIEKMFNDYPEME